MGQQLLGTSLSDNAFLPKDQPFWKQLILGASPGLSQGIGQGGSLWGLSKLGLL
jgi:hypothetical protein